MQTTITHSVFLLSVLLISNSTAYASTPTETVAEALQKVENMSVNDTARPIKEYAVRAFKNAVNTYCHAENLAPSECANKQVSEMRKWHKEKADRAMEARNKQQ
jgi:hypothetical protein